MLMQLLLHRSTEFSKKKRVILREPILANYSIVLPNFKIHFVFSTKLESFAKPYYFREGSFIVPVGIQRNGTILKNLQFAEIYDIDVERSLVLIHVERYFVGKLASRRNFLMGKLGERAFFVHDVPGYIDNIIQALIYILRIEKDPFKIEKDRIIWFGGLVLKKLKKQPRVRGVFTEQPIFHKDYVGKAVVLKTKAYVTDYIQHPRIGRIELEGYYVAERTRVAEKGIDPLELY